MTGHGGWPMTVFLTPDGEPFFCGTYFPPATAPGMPSFRTVCQSVARTWAERRERGRGAGADVVRAAGRARVAPPPASPRRPDGRAARRRRAAGWRASTTRRRGGFGGAPKFPPSMVLEFLLRHHARTGDADALRMVEGTCEAMARGGIYDQLAGGFARYSVDAQLGGAALREDAVRQRVAAARLRALVAGDRIAARPAGRRARRATGWSRELRTARGRVRVGAGRRHARAMEGRLLRLDPGQLVEVLGPDDGAWAAALLRGHRRRHVRARRVGAAAAARPRRTTARWRPACGPAARAARRSGRSRPATTRWSPRGTGWRSRRWPRPARCSTGPTWSRPRDRGRRAARSTCTSSTAGCAGCRATASSARPAGVLEDYADVAEGCSPCTGDRRSAWLDSAGALLDVVLEHFADGSRRLLRHRGRRRAAASRARRRTRPTTRRRPGAAAVAGALLTYAALTGSADHREAAERGARAAGCSSSAAPAVRRLGAGGRPRRCVAGPREVAVVDAPGAGHGWRALAHAPRAPSSSEPAATSSAARRTGPAAGGVRLPGFVCDAPTTDGLRGELGVALSAVDRRGLAYAAVDCTCNHVIAMTTDDQHATSIRTSWLSGRLPEDWFDGRARDHRRPRRDPRRRPLAAPDAGGATPTGRRSRPDLPVPRGHPRPADRDRPRGRAALRPQGRVGRRVRRAAATLFTTLSVPVMTRLRQPERRVLDTLVDAGVARSRSRRARLVRPAGRRAHRGVAAALRCALRRAGGARARSGGEQRRRLRCNS